MIVSTAVAQRRALVVFALTIALMGTRVVTQSWAAGAFAMGKCSAYGEAYAAPGAMRAGFEWYRAFPTDIAMNRQSLAEGGKLDIPVVAVGGAASLSGSLLHEMVGELSHKPSATVVDRAGHWIPEERPDALVEIVEGLAREVG